jgi:hypothetical protein
VKQAQKKGRNFSTFKKNEKETDVLRQTPTDKVAA